MTIETSPTKSAAPLRILHLTAGSDAGGISRYLHELSLSLRRRGHGVTIAGQPGGWHDLFVQSQITWLALPLKAGPLDLWRASRSLLRVLRRQPVDILHAHYRKATLVARRLSRELDIPVLYTLHLTGIPMNWPWRSLTDWGDHVHAPAEDGRRWLIDQAHVDPQRITVIPHGVDPGKFPCASEVDRQQARAQLGLEAEATIAAFVGRFDDPKNEGWMLDLAKAAQQRLGDRRVQVVLVGGGPHEAALVRRVRDEQLGERVKLLGYGDPLPVYQAADVIMIPSAKEGFSLVTAEAMSVGRPVLRTRTAGTSEQIIEQVTGLSVPIDHTAFIDAAIDLLSDRPRLARLGAAAAQHAREHLTLDRQVDDTIALYRRLIAAHRA